MQFEWLYAINFEDLKERMSWQIQINLNQFFKEKKKLYYLVGSIFLLIVLIASFFTAPPSEFVLLMLPIPIIAFRSNSLRSHSPYFAFNACLPFSFKKARMEFMEKHKRLRCMRTKIRNYVDFTSIGVL